MRKTCSFCGRSEKEVKLLISGVDGQICDSCTAQAYNILKEPGLLGQNAKKNGKGVKAITVPKPKQIK